MRLLFTALACLILFSSCNPDEELTENGDVFIGTWQYIGYLNSNGEPLNDTSNDLDPCVYQTNFIVESDGNLIFTISVSDNIESPVLDDNGNIIFSGDCVTQILVGQADIINETIMNCTMPSSNNNGFVISVAEITDEGVLRWMDSPSLSFDGYDPYFEKID